MTEKEHFLTEITKIKNEHIKQRAVAEKNLKNPNVCKEITPSEHSECVCDKFIIRYKEKYGNLYSFKSFVKDHEEFHRIYEAGFNKIKTAKENGFKSRFLKKSASYKTEDSYIETIKSVSDNIVSSLNNIYEDVKELF